MHTIRLRGPWDYQPLTRLIVGPTGRIEAHAEGLPPAGKQILPADWAATLGPDFRGRVGYVRHFQRPTNLEPQERVWLALDEVDCAAQIHLNGKHLGSCVGRDGPVRFDITGHLQPRNRLEVVVELPCEPPSGGPLPRPAGRADRPGGLTGEVRLEIV